jgi:hypothetical protein
MQQRQLQPDFTGARSWPWARNREAVQSHVRIGAPAGPLYILKSDRSKQIDRSKRLICFPFPRLTMTGSCNRSFESYWQTTRTERITLPQSKKKDGSPRRREAVAPAYCPIGKKQEKNLMETSKTKREEETHVI